MIYRLDFRKCELPKRFGQNGKVTGIEILEYEEACYAVIFRENPTLLSIVLLNRDTEMDIMHEIQFEEGTSMIQ